MSNASWSVSGGKIVATVAPASKFQDDTWTKKSPKTGIVMISGVQRTGSRALQRVEFDQAHWSLAGAKEWIASLTRMPAK